MFWKIALIIVAALVGAYFWFQSSERVQNFLDVDHCIDAGGCWDSVDDICRKHEPNAQKLCDRVNSEKKSEQIDNSLRRIEICECLAERKDLWLCGLSDEPIAYDNPKRIAINDTVTTGAKLSYSCEEF
ncbi:MAG: hypothetical protein DHS20C05_08480 [Hyphococcus sp.]|nr:MAG: hypothetical protein DHS20C05_08480 [Marinicaulis sp.]